MRIRIRDKIACRCRVAQPLGGLVGDRDDHGIIQHRWTPAELLIPVDPIALSRFNTPYLWRHDFQYAALLFDGLSERLDQRAVNPVTDQAAEFAASKGGLLLLQDTQRRRRL